MKSYNNTEISFILWESQRKNIKTLRIERELLSNRLKMVIKQKIAVFLGVVKTSVFRGPGPAPARPWTRVLFLAPGVKLRILQR